MKNDRLNEVLRRIEQEEREQSRRAWWPLYALGLLVLGGIGMAYYYTDKHDREAGDVVLPAALGHTPSRARQDLSLYVRSLYELAQEADRKLAPPGPQLEHIAQSFRQRLVQARETGRSLEPQVTREESRVLAAATHAEKKIEQFVNGVTSALTYKHEPIEAALRQLERAKKIAAGDEKGAEELDQTPILGMASQVKNISANLAEIKRAQKALQGVERESLQDVEPAMAPAPKASASAQ